MTWDSTEPNPVGIFFFRPSLGGGTTTFTAHLFKALAAAGFTPVIYRVKANSEDRLRQFGKYDGVFYQNVSVEDAVRIVRKIPTVMGSPANSKYLVYPDLIMDLMKKGMRTVIHDPNEFTIYDHLGKVTKLPTRPICIRPTMQRFYKDALWIPHPYMRSGGGIGTFAPSTKHAVSVARIAAVKRPKIILEANRLLPKKLRVELKGAEYRLYTRSLEQKFGDVFQQCGSTFQFPMTFEAPVEICAQYKYNVDMTFFKDDGGGTQYAQMEAMDAGCVNIMHEDWFRYGGEVKPGKHVIAVNGPEHLAGILRPNEYDNASLNVIRNNAFNLLNRHAPKVIGELYKEELLRE